MSPSGQDLSLEGGVGATENSLPCAHISMRNTNRWGDGAMGSLGFSLVGSTEWPRFLDKVRLGDAWFSLKCRPPSFLASFLLGPPACLSSTSAQPCVIVCG